MNFKLVRGLRQGAKQFSITALTVPALLLLCQGRAEAILNYYIFEDAGSLKIVTTGSLRLSGLGNDHPTSCTTTPPPGGALSPTNGLICSGEESTPTSDPYKKYSLSGPTQFSDGNSNLIENANTTTGTANWLFGQDTGGPTFYILNSYTDGTPIDSSATFNSKFLSDVGLDTTPPGTNIGSWYLGADSTDASRIINVIVGAPPSPSVPGPLPLVGTAAAFGWSRRLRRRIGSVSKP
jgi:hypothetical protein